MKLLSPLSIGKLQILWIIASKHNFSGKLCCSHSHLKSAMRKKNSMKKPFPSCVQTRDEHHIDDKHKVILNGYICNMY